MSEPGLELIHVYNHKHRMCGHFAEPEPAHDPTTCVTTWLASERAEKALAEALYSKEWLDQGVGAERARKYCAGILSALTESVKR